MLADTRRVLLAAFIVAGIFIVAGWQAESPRGGVQLSAANCSAGQHVAGVNSNGSLNCTADSGGGGGVPTGSIIFVDSGTCPAGFTEDSALSGRVVEFTLAANGDVGTTGGSDSITPAGSIAVSAGPSATTTFKAASSGTSTTVASSTHTHAAGSFTGTSFDNRSAFIRVIGCKAN